MIIIIRGSELVHFMNHHQTIGRMRLTLIRPVILFLISGIFICSGCHTNNKSSALAVKREPAIEPDYSGVTIPHNMAPMNFSILEEGVHFTIRGISSSGQHAFVLKSRDGRVRFPQKKWKALLADNRGKLINFEISIKLENGERIKYDPISIHISSESIDPYLCYRMINPGYESWSGMKIIQRSLEDFSESSIFENQLLEGNCMNCHTFLKQNPEEFLIHVRGSLYGTYFVEGKEITRRNLRTENMIANAVYPAWHPEGRYVVFSSNEVLQVIHMMPGKRNEFYDQSSKLVIFDPDLNTMKEIGGNDTIEYIGTFPCWSPCGKYLYYCRTEQLEGTFDLSKQKYDLARRPFDPISGLFGNVEVLLDAQETGKSISLPGISPEGDYLLFTMHDYGTSPVWHKESDLYMLDLNVGKFNKMDLNSSEVESYHSWSTNGKWIVFSSKRGDGITARPYLAYFGSPDDVGKPFVLPQKDPTLYKRLDLSFNRPEFVTGKINVGPRDFAAASRKVPVHANWSDNE